MRIALITTTIRQPEVLWLYRHHAGPKMPFYVALDQNMPDNLVWDGGDQNTHFIWPDAQRKWKCSEPFGWNTTLRRNIALLEALQGGADVIVTIDDDNIPINEDYFVDFRSRLYCSDGLKFAHQGEAVSESRWDLPFFDGLCATGEWFDSGALLVPQTPHRGMPHRHRLAPFALRPVTQARVGVAAGLCLHDPDISAITRLANAPVVHDVTAIARAGVAVDPTTTWTVFNSQNTSFVRDLAPAMAMLAGVGRNEDIFASLLCQRVMRERGYVTHFGLPLVAQQRNLHDLFHDLEQELFGERHILDFTEYLDSLTSEELGGSVLDAVRAIYRLMPPWMPKQTSEAGFAFLEDMESVL